MKFGTLYSYWSRAWDCDYAGYARLIGKVAAIGFDILEVSADHVYRMTESELVKLNDLCRQHRIGITTNSGPSKEYDLASTDPAVRERGIAYFATIMEKMKLIDSADLAGAIYSYWPCDYATTDKAGAWDRSIDSLQKVAVKAEALDITIALEVLNRNETYILTSSEEAIDYCRKVDSKAVKILLDTYHMNIEEDNLIDAIRLAGPLLAHFHVGENNRKLPGMNNSIDWAGVGAALNEIHYDKAVVMEPFLLSGGPVSESIRVWRDLSNGATPAEMDRYIMDSLSFLRQKFS